MYTFPAAAATAGVNRSRPAAAGLTGRGAVHDCPPSEEVDSTMSFSPAELNRLSCHTTYICPVDGSIAAAGTPPVRMPGTAAPRNWPMVAGAVQVVPPSWEVWATS
jgi:hypothetical protein